MVQQFDALRQFPKILKPSDIWRFWMFVDKKGENDCWLWIGARNHAGYGSFKLFGKAWAAHRVSYKINVGDPGWDLVLHDDYTCRSKACVNPNHLRLGTQSENMLESFECGKHTHVGSNNIQSLLIEREVELIRDRIHNGDSQSQIARDLGVRPQVVNKVARGESWNHV